jgi:hypothetical protein
LERCKQSRSLGSTRRRHGLDSCRTRTPGDSTLGHVLEAAGLTDLKDVIVRRHTICPNARALVQGRSEQGVLTYTRRATEANVLPKSPPPLWLVLIAEGERGAPPRLFMAHENRGEVLEERTDEFRSYDASDIP